MTLKKSSSGSDASGGNDVLAGSSLAGGSRNRKGAKVRGGTTAGGAGGAGGAARGARTSGGARGGVRAGVRGGARKAELGRGKSAPRGKGALLRHDFAVVFRQLLPLVAVMLAAGVVAMPVSTAAIPDASIFNLDYTHDQMKFRFWLDTLTYPVVLGSAVFGVVLGLRACRFMLVKCESTAVLSLPLSRSSLFATRFLACLLAIVVGIGVPLTISLVVNIVALNIWDGLFEQFAYVLCGLVLTAVVSCALACVACAVAGTVAEAAAFAVALLASVSVAAWGLNAVMDYLLVGNAFGESLMGGTVVVADSLLDSWATFNPLLFFATQAAEHQVFIVQHPLYYPVAGNWLLLAGWTVALVVLVALALALVRRRKGERAGIAGLSVVLSAVCGIVVGLAAFGATFTLMAGLDVLAAVVGAFVVFWLVSLVMFRGPLKGKARISRTLGVVGAESVVLACVLVCVGMGGLGYSALVPQTSEVKSVSVSYTGSPSYLATGLDTATAGDGSYYYSTEYTFDDADAIEIVRQVHTQLTDMGHAQLAEDRSNFAGTVVPYDVVFRYTLADGSEVVRYYDRATLAQLEELTQLDDTTKARELSRAAVSGDLSLLGDDDASALGSSVARQAYALGDIYIADRLYTAPMLVNCDAQARSELLAALAEDVANQSVDDRYHPQAGACRGVLMFTQAGESAAETFAYGIENTVVYLTDEFTNTLAWFEQKGLSAYLVVGGAAAVSADGSMDAAALGAEAVAAQEVSAVESMTFQRYAPYEGMNAITDPQSAYFMGYRATVNQQFISMQDFGTKYSTEDAAEIAELLPLTRSTYYLDSGGYLVSVKLVGQEAYTYLFIPLDEAPEWLIRVAGA